MNERLLFFSERAFGVTEQYTVEVAELNVMLTEVKHPVGDLNAH